MNHIHEVIDMDVHYKIDNVTRAITNLDETKKSLVQNDHNSERFTFELPRYIEGHDLSSCNKVQVHYVNKGIDGEESVGVYDVEDLKVSEEEENTVAFSWLISDNTTKHEGTISFSIHFACVNEEGIETYAWNTLTFEGIEVLKSLHNSESINERYPDILDQIKNKIKELEENGSCKIKAYDNLNELMDVGIYFRDDKEGCSNVVIVTSHDGVARNQIIFDGFTIQRRNHLGSEGWSEWVSVAYDTDFEDLLEYLGSIFASKEEIKNVEERVQKLEASSVITGEIFNNGLVYSQEAEEENNWALYNMVRDTIDGKGGVIYSTMEHKWGNDESKIAKIRLNLSEPVRFNEGYKVVIETVLSGYSNQKGRMAIRLNSNENGLVYAKDGAEQKFTTGKNHCTLLCLFDDGNTSKIGVSKGIFGTTGDQTLFNWEDIEGYNGHFVDGPYRKVVIILDKINHVASYELYDMIDEEWQLLKKFENMDLGYFSRNEYLTHIDIMNHANVMSTIHIDYVKVWNVKDKDVENYENINTKKFGIILDK